MNKFEKIGNISLEATKIQDNLEKYIRKTGNTGTTLDINLKTGENKVKHKLNKVPTEWQIVDVNAAITVYCKNKTNTELTLVSSGNAKVKIKVG